MIVDAWGEPVSGSAASVACWDRAWAKMLHFRGDPMTELEAANRDDPEFVLGSVYNAAYYVLAGTPPDAPQLTREVERVDQRSDATGERDQSHVKALRHLLAGDYTRAAEVWDGIAARANDFAAVRIAHDVYLHVGDADGRLRSSLAAADRWQSDDHGYNFVQGQLAFALEESGRLDEAERVGRAALDLDPDDLWARHALAHVYETADDQQGALDLLDGPDAVWHDQDALSTHIWWHLALRLISVGEYQRVLSIHDQELAVATTAFRLCDLTSMLWRLELVGVVVADRWSALADRWTTIAERHTCGFIDLHASLVFLRQSAHRGATPFFEGLEASHRAPVSENGHTFSEVVRPLLAAMRSHVEGDHATAATRFDNLAHDTHRIGGSNTQRDLITLTRNASADLSTSNVATTHLTSTVKSRL